MRSGCTGIIVISFGVVNGEAKWWTASETDARIQKRLDALKKKRDERKNPPNGGRRFRN